MDYGACDVAGSTIVPSALVVSHHIAQTHVDALAVNWVWQYGRSVLVDSVEWESCWFRLDGTRLAAAVRDSGADCEPDSNFGVFQMATEVIVALVSSVVSLLVGAAGLIANRGGQRADAYKTLSETVANLSNELDELRRTQTLKDGYVVYLIDGIREHCDWKPLSFFKWQQAPNGKTGAE